MFAMHNYFVSFELFPLSMGYRYSNSKSAMRFLLVCGGSIYYFVFEVSWVTVLLDADVPSFRYHGGQYKTIPSSCVNICCV